MSSNIISNLFHERSQFIVIGLTGRTGSGCTTTATILEEKKPQFPSPEDVRYLGNYFFSETNKIRYQILSRYAAINFKQFISIKVSDLISAYILQSTESEAIEFISRCSTSQAKEKIENTINSGSFKKSTARQGSVSKKISRILLDPNRSESDLKPKLIREFFSYMRRVRKFTNDFKKELREIDNDLYLKVYQEAGNSIRRVGKVYAGYESLEFVPESVFYLPETINRVIKIIRKIQGEKGAFIVIDAIRNPYEAKFFKDRYSAFYLVSINAPDEDRKRYLQNVHKYTVDEFDNLEKRESGSNQISDEDFTSQNVKRCIEISDIHIFNPRSELNNNNVLKAQLAWYVSLMLHPGLVTPTALERVMQLAYSAKINSGCISRQVGAVVTDNNYSVKAVGWNDVAKGQTPCNMRSLNGLINSYDDIVYSEFERNNKEFRDNAIKHFELIKNEVGTEGKNLAYCFKDLKNEVDKKGNQVHTRSLHAEENAFLQLAKYGSSGIEGGKLFTTASPCELCAKKAYQLGIEEIVYIDPYPGIAKDHVISIGSKRPKLVQFRGAVGKAHHLLYEPMLPYKDELNYLKRHTKERTASDISVLQIDDVNSQSISD